MSRPPIDKETAQRVRELIKARFTQAEIAAECGVSRWFVSNQVALLDALKLFKRRSRAEAVSEERRARQSDIGRQSFSAAHARRGCDFNEANLDVCQIFETPRSPRQIARALRGEE